jgi:hypothetical protein
MLDYPIVPPIEVVDTPKPRRLSTINEARAYVDEQLRLGRLPLWREMLARLDGVKEDEEAIEAIGALRELLSMEHLLVSGVGALPHR